MKKLVNLLKNYLTKSSPAVVEPTFKMEQFKEAKKNLLNPTSSKGGCCNGGECKCAHKETPKPKTTSAPATKKPVAKKSTKPKAE